VNIILKDRVEKKRNEEVEKREEKRVEHKGMRKLLENGSQLPDATVDRRK